MNSEKLKFDVFEPMQVGSKRIFVPGTKSKKMDIDELLAYVRQGSLWELVSAVQAGDKEKKKALPAVCWTGFLEEGKTRKDEFFTPSQFVMIDIDHMENVSRFIETIGEDRFKAMQSENLCLIHVTPSGKGVRLVFRASRMISTLADYMLFLDDKFKFHLLGDFDPSVKNVGRLSFLVPENYFLYVNYEILRGEVEFANDPIVESGESITEETKKRKSRDTEEKSDSKKEEEADAQLSINLNNGNGGSVFTKDEEAQFTAFRYRGFELSVIIAKYLEAYGEPGDGERHNYYNEMVKNFRCITDNNKRLLLFALPRFGHSVEECWSQINSICRSNTLSRLPRSFYFFLKDNGFYDGRGKIVDDMKEYMMEEVSEKEMKLPYLPPVFRECLGTAPKDFIVPMMNALLPIMGTLTSYVRAIYPYDNREHSTSFFSVIYAPPGTGKGFVERFMEIFFKDLKLRDYVQSERENVYLRILNRKGANDKAPEMPHVSLRLIPAKNSEAEFLQKQRDNQGYHMFTYAAEMDSWAKGVKAAGGNKDDMIRIAWDNGEYGQQFKSSNTFKGSVNLYWNVLITGTIQQVENYFKNVENGLVTRCSFCSIDNQEFVAPPKWKNLGKQARTIVERFVERCDRNTYESPCTIDIDSLVGISDDDFDREVDWRFKFKEKKKINVDWIMPTINAFHEEQVALAAKDLDRARDVFRRRVGVRGFRLAMICTCLWENPRKQDLERCAKFVDWWMHVDLDNILKLWGQKYNEQTETVMKVVQRSLFNELEAKFTRNDVYVLCMKQGIKTPIRRIIYEWKKLGYIASGENKETFIKKVKQ